MVTRRIGLSRGRAGALAAVALLLAGCASEPPSPLAGPHAPGIVIAVVDTMRADHLGCYGYARDTSPNIDRLAAEGLVFDAAITQASFSGPAYATLFTAKLPQEHGVRDHPRVLALDNDTLAEAASRMGLATAGFVAHPFLAAKWSYDQGFKTYQLLEAPRGWPKPVGRAADVVDAAIAWLDHLDPEQPFLLFVQLMEAHMPYMPDPPFDTAFGSEPPGYGLMKWVIDSKGQHGPVMFSFRERGYTDSDRERTIQLYDGTIAESDAQLGRLFAKLAERGRMDRTLVAVTADHGEMLGEHDIYFQHDMSLYDPVVRVPLVLRYPAKLKQPGRITTQVRMMDLAPTLLDLIGVPGPEGATGRSMRPIFGGVDDERVAYAENQPLQADRVGLPHYRMELPGILGKWRMVRSGGAKLILIPTQSGIREELYDLVADPGETHNLLGQAPELEERLRQLLRANMAADPGLRGEQGSEAPADEQTLEELRSLGYIG